MMPTVDPPSKTLPKTSVNRQGVCFDSLALRIVAYMAWLIPMGWAAAMIYWDPMSPVGALLLKHVFVPVWLVLAPVVLYYAHLLAFRFRLSLAAFMVLILLWGNALAIAWACGGYEAGITVCLGLGALFGQGVTWGESISQILNISRSSGRVSASILGILAPPAVWALVFSLWIAWIAYSASDGLMLVASIGACTLALAIIMARGWVHRRARTLIALASRGE